MKIRAKKEVVAAFLNERTGLELISQKAGWSTIEFIKGNESSNKKHDQEMLKSYWNSFIEARNGDFEDKMLESINVEIEEIEDPEVLAVAKDAQEQREAEEAWMNEPDPNAVITQRAYNGNMEALPAGKFTERIECHCGEIRWIQKADVFQVTKCKPCTIKERRARQYASRKARKDAEKGNITAHGTQFLESQSLTIH